MKKTLRKILAFLLTVSLLIPSFAGLFSASADEWSDYEATLQKYEEDLASYQSWQKYYSDLDEYWEYQNYLTNYSEKHDAYLKYEAVMEQIDDRLDILDNIFVEDSRGWKLSSSLEIGVSAVESFDQSELSGDLLSALNSLRTVIEAAGESSGRLSELVDEYESLCSARYDSEFERKTTLFAFYTANWSEMGRKFTSLGENLASLYTNSFIGKAINEKEKTKDQVGRYMQLIGQLYVMGCCLDDTNSVSTSKMIISSPRKKLDQIVEAVHIFEDTNKADPSGITVPSEEVTDPESMTPVEKPVKPETPEVSSEPVKPQEPHRHKATSKVDGKYLKSAATCTSAAVYYQSCSECGEALSTTFTSGETAAHNYNQRNTSSTYLKSAATCQSKAVYYYSCTCGAKGSGTFESGSTAAHQFTKQVQTKAYLATEASCVAPATYYYKCANCDAAGNTTYSYGSTIAHQYDNQIVAPQYLCTEATHTSPAVYYKSCICGAKGTKTFTSGSPVAHTYNQKNTSGTYLKSAATHESAAVYYYSCSCGAVGSATFSFGEPIAHKFDRKDPSSDYLASAATHKDAATYYYSCSCGRKGETTFSYGNPIPHTYDKMITTDAYLATPQSGKIAATYYYSCACGAAGTATFAYQTHTTHTFNQKITSAEYLVSEATCQKAAVYRYSCTCGDIGTETFSDGSPTAHIFNRKVTTAAYLKAEATHTAAAVYYYCCATCDEKGSATYTSGNPVAHTYDQKKTVNTCLKSEATCTEAATYYYVCSCGAVGTATFQSGEPLGHTFNQAVASADHLAKAATCESQASYYYSCSCGENGTSTFVFGSKLPHTFEERVTTEEYLVPGTQATYYYSCVCGRAGTTTFTDGEEVPDDPETEVVPDITGDAVMAANRTKKGLTFSELGIAFSFSKDGVRILSEAETTGIFVERETFRTFGTIYSIRPDGGVTDGIPDSTELGSVVLSPSKTQDYADEYFVKNAVGEWKPVQTNTLVLTKATRILYRKNYSINLSKDTETDSFRAGTLPTSSYAGETVKINPTCEFGYEVVNLSVTDANQKNIEVNPDNSFVMPDSAVSISFEIEKIVYSAKFYVGDEVIFEGEYGLYETISSPDTVPTKAETEDYRYEFIGWSPDPATVGAAGENRNLEYHAQFAEISLKDDSWNVTNLNNVFLPIILAVGGGLLAIGGGVFFLVRGIRKKKLRPDETADANENKQ